MRAIVRALAPAGGPRPTSDLLGPAWASLFGARVEAWPSAPVLTTRARLEARWSSGAQALFADFDHPTLGVCAAAIDAAFARRVADRALRAPDGLAVVMTSALTPAHEGALALLCARAASIACAPGPAPTIRAVTELAADALETLCAGEGGALLCWPLRVSVGLDVGEVTLLGDPASLLRAQAGAHVGALALPSVREHFSRCALEYALVAARADVRAQELVEMQVGDVWLCEGALAPETAGEGLVLEGAMVLTLGAFEFDLHFERGRATIARAARARRDVPSRVETQRHEAMSDAEREQVVTPALLERATVTLDVIVATGTVTLGEVAAWRVGEVIELSTRVGAPVLLRAGGQLVARGELVDVEGDVGVRVIELL